MEKSIDNVGLIGETLVAFLASIATDGEAIRKTRAGEGGNSVDFDLFFPSVISPNTDDYATVQVKTGVSFLKNSGKSYRIDGIKNDHLEKWKKSTSPTVLAAVDVENPYKCFYKFINKHSQSRLLKVGEYSKITPSFRYSLGRFIKMHAASNKTVPKINIAAQKNLIEARVEAKKSFHTMKGSFDAYLGKISITKYALIHMTRNGKNRGKIFDSLLLFPSVKKVLGYKPSRIFNLESTVVETGSFVKEEKRILLVYRNIKFSDNMHPMALYIRLNEITEYNAKWHSEKCFDKSLRHILRVESIYRKGKVHPLVANLP